MNKPVKSSATPGKTASSVKGAPITEKNTTGEAFGLILDYNLRFMLTWAPVALQGEDIEGVHQARVALRRLRSALGLFRKAIPREVTDPWGAEMQWVASAMGAARDLDVFISEGLNAMAGKIPLESGERKLLALARTRRDEAYAHVRETLEGERYKRFTDDFAAWIAAAGWKQGELSEAGRKRIDGPIRRYASRVLADRLHRALAYGEHMGAMSSTELHALRIECKKLRYAFEFFQPLFLEKGVQNFGLQLKGLQDLLGVMNDVSVMPGLMDTVLQGSTDLETVQYAGALIGWRSRQYEEVRGQLDARWNEFAASSLFWSK